MKKNAGELGLEFFFFFFEVIINLDNRTNYILKILMKFFW
jgi:hypothetical protein